MKTIFTFLISSFFALSSFAYEGTRISISSKSNTTFFAEVDGKRFQLNDKAVLLRNQEAGFHTIKVFSETKRINGIWDLIFGNYRQDIIYENRVYLRNGHHFNILVNGFGKVVVNERRINRNDKWDDDDDDDLYDKNRGRDRNYDRDNRYDNNDARAMSFHEFSQVKDDLQRERSENKRAGSAIQALRENYFLSWQIKELLLLFSSEKKKLDLAKFAYTRTTDKQVFYIVNDVFASNKSKDELARHIREYNKNDWRVK